MLVTAAGESNVCRATMAANTPDQAVSIEMPMVDQRAECAMSVINTAEINMPNWPPGEPRGVPVAETSWSKEVDVNSRASAIGETIMETTPMVPRPK